MIAIILYLLNKEIGGFIEFGFYGEEREYHKDLLRFNFARNALVYLLKCKSYKKVFLPYYTCPDLIHTLEKYEFQIDYYRVNECLEIIGDFSIGKETCLVYTNYFGLKDSYIEIIANKINNLIIDNAQAFFSRPLSGIDTFYSARKFFGVPDGAYLSSNTSNKISLEKGFSDDKFSHLVKRLEISASYAYNDFLENENKIGREDISEMSRFTQGVLSYNIDYHFVASKRRENFMYLNERLIDENKLRIDLSDEAVPLTYPFLTEHRNLKTYLISKKIYIPTYWKGLNIEENKNRFECELVDKLICLPIDQRYGIEEMEIIVDSIIEFKNQK